MKGCKQFNYYLWPRHGLAPSNKYSIKILTRVLQAAPLQINKPSGSPQKPNSGAPELGLEDFGPQCKIRFSSTTYFQVNALSSSALGVKLRRHFYK